MRYLDEALSTNPMVANLNILKEALELFEHCAFFPPVDSEWRALELEHMVLSMENGADVVASVNAWRTEVVKDEQRIKQALIEFFKIHNKEKLSKIDDMLRRYELKEIIDSLQRKYGSTPKGLD